MMIFTHDHATNSSGLILINTLISQDLQRNFRLFCIPTRYSDLIAPTSIDYDMSLGTLDQDGPFTVDQTQAFIILQFFGGEEPNCGWVILCTQALIEHACSMRTETYIPWEEWGRDAIVMGIPTFSPAIYVQGVHAVEAAMRTVPDSFGRVHIYLRTFNFSKWGCSTFCDEGGEAVRETRYEDGRGLFLKGSDVGLVEFGPPGNSVFYSVVSRLCH